MSTLPSSFPESERVVMRAVRDALVGQTLNREGPLTFDQASYLVASRWGWSVLAKDYPAAALRAIYSKAHMGLLCWTLRLEHMTTGMLAEWAGADPARRLELERAAAARQQEASEDWWQREGRHEEALEERGQTKDWEAACRRADQFGERRPTAAEFAAYATFAAP